MRRLLFLLSVLVLCLLAAGWWIKFEHKPPQATFATETAVVGRNAVWDLSVDAPGWPGLRRVEVLLSSAGPVQQLLLKEYPPLSWIGSGVSRDTFHVTADLGAAGVPEGPAELQVNVETYAWKVVAPRRRLAAAKQVQVDLTPPRIEVISTQHNIRLGGSSVAVFRVSPDAERLGIAVGDYFFPATLGYFSDPAVALSIFAVPQDLSSEAQPRIEVRDAVGNTRVVALPCRIRDRKFRERPLNIDDQFLARKVPELLAANGLPDEPDLVQGYLIINGALRRRTEEKLREIVARSADRPLWDGAFRRQSNSATMSSFADRRVYLHDGQIIDRQTHLGYDLASLEGASVDATQNGVVVFAGALGIYGQTVILDHGLGVFSLYGHLRSIAVQSGQQVKGGDGLGQTGATGLAGGDHLHYSIMLYGTHVDPVEWWDPMWIRDHVTAKLSLLPAAVPTAPGGAIAGEAAESSMAKTGRDDLRREGERLLEQWEASSSATLEPLIGRSEAADIAIAQRLGRQATEESVRLLQELERTAGKEARKEAKRSLYRLEQRGLSIPRAIAEAPTAPVLAAPVEGYLSSVDGRGDQLVWLIRSRPGGLGQLFTVVNDPEGLREVEFNLTTRKALRGIRAELEAKHELVLVPAGWRYCDYLAHRAFEWARDRKASMLGDYPAARAQILREAPPADLPPLILSHLDADSVRTDSASLGRSNELLNEKEFRTWFFGPERMRPYLEELASIKDSPLVLSPLQQKDRFAACVDRALAELFSGEQRDSYTRRLQEMAYFFQATQRPARAREALATALALAESTAGGAGIPFCESLVQTSLAAWIKVEEQEEQERSRSSLVLTPQQIAQRQRR